MKSFEKFQCQKEALLASLSTWPVERMRFRPEPTAWSALDVLDHILKVERGLLDAVRINLPNSRPVVLKERLAALIVNCVMLSPLRIKVPAATMVLPGTTADLSLIVRQWNEAGDEIAGMLNSLSPEQLRCGVFRHPVSGWMAMPQAIMFLFAHLRHHRYQINR